MASVYTEGARFSDPVFPDLRGDEVGGMWRMLCLRGDDLQLTFDHIQADDGAGSARWEARYTFRATGRVVTNRVRSRFELADGRVTRQVDRFPFYAWSRQALGLPGWLLGWTPLLRAKVQRTADAQLRKFLAAETTPGR